MPTVDWINGLRVVIYPNDHLPIHVHVIGNGCEAIIKLHSSDGKLEVRENYGFSEKELKAIKNALTPKRVQLIHQWSIIHDNRK